MKNYLVLTPDGVGSTYLQRSLTVYLNLAGIDYTNTHELLNGLELVNGGLRKNFEYGYSQTADQIVQLLESNTGNIVSRIANYHIKRRLLEQQEDYTDFYKTCNQKFNTIIMCERDPFEYALSWSIRHITGKLNTYSIQEQIEAHPHDKKYDINLEFFLSKLDHYSSYTYWVADNFEIDKHVKYNNLITNHTEVLQYVTDLEYNIDADFNINFTDYSNVMYNITKFIETKDSKFLVDKSKGIATVKLYLLIQKLVKENKLISTVPLKMNTLNDKMLKTKNFPKVLDTYNKWTQKTNQFLPISSDLLKESVKRENKIYEP